jgi:hypothetical protein
VESYVICSRMRELRQYAAEGRKVLVEWYWYGGVQILCSRMGLVEFS